MTFAFFWFLFAVAVGIFASNRGRSGFGWFLLSALISPLLGLLFCAVCKDLSERSGVLVPSARTHRKCPACAEFVLPEAVICKHCKTPLPVNDHAVANQITARKMAEADEKAKFIVGAVIVVAVLAAMVMFRR